MNNYYPFINTPLPCAYDALEPFIDEKTMHLHHDRHLQTYIDNLNRFLEEHPSLQNCSLEELLTMGTDGIQADLREARAWYQKRFETVT